VLRRRLDELGRVPRLGDLRKAKKALKALHVEATRDEGDVTPRWIGAAGLVERDDELAAAE
jgi:hypothetical protein